MSTIQDFVQGTARPLPVIILADVSGSMGQDSKIGALNAAMREMITSFADEADIRAEIHVSVITFGGTAQVHIPLQSAAEVIWTDMNANGGTPLGAAVDLAISLIDDRERIPSRAYRPLIVLVSDGQPNDAWQPSLERLTQAGRAAKADRMALGIGADADVTMLRRFVADPEKPVYRAEDATRIKDFFQFVTMSVTSRTRSPNPNLAPVIENPRGLDFF